MNTVSIPYGGRTLTAQLPAPPLFTGAMKEVLPLADFAAALRQGLDAPLGCPPLWEQVRPGDRVLILIDDNTRATPVDRILPELIPCLTGRCGVDLSDITLLTAPGTHRVMTERELVQKIGAEWRGRLRVLQHDCNDRTSMVDLGAIELDGRDVPLVVNRAVLEHDYIIGLGNIIPHSDAGFSAGGKIVQPGICGCETTAATHVAGALLPDIPLGLLEGNTCREGIERAAKRAGLKFIVNTVLRPDGKPAGVFCGDPVAAHRAGCKLSAEAYGTPIPVRADIVIVSSSPCDIDYWQAEKCLVAAYFSVRPGGVIIFAAPCFEGMEHNHPRLRDWCRLRYDEAKSLVSSLPPDSEEDLVAADIAMANSRVRERARILAVTDGLTDGDLSILGYGRCPDLQTAVDRALSLIPGGSFGVLPRGGDCFPYLV